MFEVIFKNVIIGVSAVDFILYFLVYSFCFYKIIQENKSLVYLVPIIFFILFKCLHIFVFVNGYTNYSIVQSILFALTITNLVLAVLPVVCLCLEIFSNRKLHSAILPFTIPGKVFILLPVYNEDPNDLIECLESIYSLDYPKDKLTVCIGFDQLEKQDDYDALMDYFSFYIPFGSRDNTEHSFEYGGIEHHINRFEHGGKKNTQQNMFNHLSKTYGTYTLSDSKLLFIDSDTKLNHKCINYFYQYSTLHKLDACTGFINCKTKGKGLLSYLQDAEYTQGQMLWRNLENYAGGVSCLPGAFTFISWSAFNSVNDEYFNSTDYSTQFKYFRYYLGEDRFLTQLLLEYGYNLGYCYKARCKTTCPDTLSVLLKQRRRWTLGHISNDTYTISSIKLWKIRPFFSLINLLNSSRNTSLIAFLVYYLIFKNIYNISIIYLLLFVAIPFLCTWISIGLIGMYIKKKMNILSYTLLFIIQPIVWLFYFYYSLFSKNKKTWGGPRTTN